MIFGWFRSKPQEPQEPPKPKPEWVYLGWTEVSYADQRGKTTNKDTLQFYALTPDLKKRKANYVWPDQYMKAHGWYQQMVIPWLEGGNLYIPIQNPSDWLKDYCERTCGYKRIDGKWVKPAPIEHREGNVVTLKTK